MPSTFDRKYALYAEFDKCKFHLQISFGGCVIINMKIPILKVNREAE